jgi:ArsR family transcriptional regulator, lead/cadmium/zinc/bismuth-responsive transcriptional repressor
MPTPGLQPVPPGEPLALRGEAAAELARLFEVLASETRLRLLHALLVLEDPCMGELAGSVGMKPQAVSNQLRRLVDGGFLATRRHGSHVHYRIADDRVTGLLRHGLRLDAQMPEGRP